MFYPMHFIPKMTDHSACRGLWHRSLAQVSGKGCLQFAIERGAMAHGEFWRHGRFGQHPRPKESRPKESRPKESRPRIFRSRDVHP